MSKSVAILGGGLFGTAAAAKINSLKNPAFKVTLISLTDFSLNLCASVRLASGGFSSSDITKDYAEFLPDDIDIRIVKEISRFEQHKVSFIPRDSDEVITEQFDYIVIATGMKWYDPIDYTRLKGHDTKALALYNDENVQRLKMAKKIVIVGGGEVGCELAGEICYSFKDKEIIIVHSQSKLFNDGFTEKARDNALAHFEKAGAKVMLSVRADLDASSETTLKLTNGHTINDIDVLIKATGPATTLPPTDLKLHDKSGFVEINEYSQTLNYPNIFAIGDVASTTFKTLNNRDRVINSVAHNLVQLSKDQPVSTFKKIPWELLEKHDKFPGVGISLGPTDGIGQLRFPFVGVCTFPSFLVVTAKSKHLFTNRDKDLYPVYK